MGIAQGCLTEGLLSFLINLSILWSMSETACSDIRSHPLTSMAVILRLQLHSSTDAHRLSITTAPAQRPSDSKQFPCSINCHQSAAVAQRLSEQ